MAWNVTTLSSQRQACPPFAALLLLVGLLTGTEESIQYVPKSDCTAQAALDHEKSHFAADPATGAEAGALSDPSTAGANRILEGKRQG